MLLPITAHCGGSNGNQIEHRLFSFFSPNGTGIPLRILATIVNLIGITIRTGPRVRCEVDEKYYPKGVKISDQLLAALDFRCLSFHGEWKYAHLHQPSNDSPIS